VDPITLALDGIRAQGAAAASSGALADYIPELARADPTLFAIALGSLDGEVYCAGDTDVALTIQSVSKPFVYALAVDRLGLEAVAERVGAEPSGEPFNAISLEPDTGRPANPLVNAGAILVTSLAEGFAPIHTCLEAFAGRSLGVDEAVFASERSTGDRNRAIAYLMRAAGSLRADVDTVIDAYFRQCSVLVTARDLAVMAATLAHGGRNPVTGRCVVSEATARHVLSVVAMCGMYDGAGEWMLRVGLPAKSGVSGGLLAVSPGQFGIGLFSPPLDAVGNSVGAVLACELLSERFGLHLLHDPTAEARTAKVEVTVPAPRSGRRRPRAQRARLERAAESISLVTLRGDMDFAAAELALRTVRSLAAAWLVLDTRAITRLHTVAERLLRAIPGELSATVALVGDDGFPTLEPALEWCEDGVLGEAGPEEHELLAELEDRMSWAPRRIAPGEPALKPGDIVLALESGRVRGPGYSVGDGGIVTGLDPGTARAEIETTGAALTRDALAAMPPEAAAALWRALAGWGAASPVTEEVL
jgi:glutaminase